MEVKKHTKKPQTLEDKVRSGPFHKHDAWVYVKSNVTKQLEYPLSGTKP